MDPARLLIKTIPRLAMPPKRSYVSKHVAQPALLQATRAIMENGGVSNTNVLLARSWRVLFAKKNVFEGRKTPFQRVEPRRKWTVVREVGREVFTHTRTCQALQASPRAGALPLGEHDVDQLRRSVQSGH